MNESTKQPIKMIPGDDTHLTMLMAPSNLNFFIGKDREDLLAYGRAAFEAGKAGQCLHQIQEPEADIWPCVNIDVDESGKITNAKLYSPGLPAGNHDVYPVRVPYMDEHTEAWRACVDELEKTVPGFMSLGNMNGIECAVAAIRGLSERAKHQEPAAAEQAAWHAGLDEGRAQAAGSVSNATSQPAPAAVAVPDERAAFEAWADARKEDSIYLPKFSDGTYINDDTHAAWEAWQARAALAATPAADAQIQSQANAWLACCEALEAVKPEFMDKDGATGLDCAIEAIKELASQPAAAPVALPEPDAWRANYVDRDGNQAFFTTSRKDLAIENDANGTPEPLYTEQQVRALLAQAATAAAPAHPAEGVQPAAGQCRFKGYEWGACHPEHVAMVLRAPEEWPDYEVRYLYAAPAPADALATATGLPAQAEGADSLKLLADIRSMAESTIKAGLVDDCELLHTFETIIKTAAKAKRPTCAICDSKGFIAFDDELARGRNGGRWGVCKTCSNTAPQALADTRENKPLIARQLGEWHEDDGPVAWWAWCGHEWAGEPAWIGTPLSDNWPGYHTHWTPHPEFPADRAAIAAAKGNGQ